MCHVVLSYRFCATRPPFALVGLFPLLKLSPASETRLSGYPPSGRAFLSPERSTGMNLKPLHKGGTARQNSGRAMAPILIG